MECARLLTLRGHSVTLFEKTGVLGGVFIAAAAPDFKEKDKQLLAWYRRQLETLGVEVRLNTEAGPETVAGYDEVVAATGAKARKLKLPGLEDPRVMEAVEYLTGVKEAGEKVVVIGGGLTGVEIAYDLALKGRKPVIVEMQKDILQVPGLCASNSNMLREIIRYYDIPVYLNTSLAGITEEGGFRVRVKEKDAPEEMLLEADSCILSVGYVPARQLADELLAGGFPAERLHVVGDAHKVENLMNVIWESYELCYKL
jgi:2-enoate reductase